MSPENFRKLAHPELEISTVNTISVRKQGNKQTDRHTRKNNKCLEIVYNIQGMSQTISEIYIIQNCIYPYIDIISVRMYAN